MRARRPHRLGTWAFLAAAVLATASVPAEDWPQWRGPRQDGVSSETGLLAAWPEKGPAEVWRVPLAGGFSSVSVVGERLYTMCAAADGEFAVCLDAANGKTLWKVRTGDLYENSYGNGPRATPCVDDGRVYALGAKGGLVCVEAAGGKTLWSCELTQKFGGAPPDYGFSASPVTFGKQLVIVTGAKNGKSLAALDKLGGDVLWTSLDDKAGYSTPVRVEVDGLPQIVVLMGEAVVGVSAADGKELWRYPWKTEQDANVATPIVQGNKLFISTGYGTGCGLFELSAKDGKPAAKLVWESKKLSNYHSTSVLVDGNLYGFSDRFLTCMDFATGEPKWKQRGFNRGTVLAADGKLIIYGERATLALAKISPESYQELAKAQVLDDKTWTPPTLAGGRLYVRNEKEMVCLQLK